MRVSSVLLVLALLSIPVVYSVAFAATSAELTRTSTIQVDTDVNGVITLTPNSAYDVIQVNEELSIDPQHVGADSMNENATLTLGDPQDPSTSEAFTIQNASGGGLTLNMSLNASTNYTGGNTDVIYYVDDDGTTTSIAVGETKSFQLNDGEEIYVAVEYNSGSSGDLTTDFVISGGSP